MRDENKVWIIDLGETLDPRQLRKTVTTAATVKPAPQREGTVAATDTKRPTSGQGSAAPRASQPAPQPAPPPRQAAPGKAQPPLRPVPRGITPPTPLSAPARPVRRTATTSIVAGSAAKAQSSGEVVRRAIGLHRPARLLLMTYLLGPLAVLAIPQGRGDRKWSVGAGLTGAASVLLLIGWGAVRARMASGGSSLGWFVAVGLVIAVGLVVWSRAVLLTGRMLKAPQVTRLPYWLRQPWAAGLAGLVVPGLGHLIAGRSRRAAVALGLLGPTALATLVLANAGRLWSGHQASGAEAAAGLALERVFVLAAAVLIAGGLIWIASALDAARLQGVAPALSRRQRGDWVAIALVVTLVVSAAAFRPTGMAQRLDHYAVALQDEGLRLVPLWCERAAAVFDPAQPAYTLRCADLYAALGEHERAEKLREHLDDRWVTYATMLRAGSWDEDAPAAEPREVVGPPVAGTRRGAQPSSTAAKPPAPRTSVEQQPVAAAIESEGGVENTGQPVLAETPRLDQLPVGLRAKVRMAAIE